MKQLMIMLVLICLIEHSFGQVLSDSTIVTDTTTYGEIVVTGSRIPESILKSSLCIQLLDVKAIRQSPAPSFFEALENAKGIQVITPSLGFKVINARGFMNATNVRFVQLVDGMDNQAPHIGAPIANNLGPNDLDISKVEIISGTASALYGMNSLNGLANFITKNPFTNQGFSFQQKTGMNHLKDNLKSVQLFTETSFRYAKAFNNKFAFKVNGSYLKGHDWIANDNTDLNPTANESLGLIGNNNPAYDGVNSYGNESPNRKTLTLGGKKYVVARTGYKESEITDYFLQNLKGDVALHYKPKKNIELAYTYKIGDLDNVYQRTNRFKLQNYIIQQHGLSIKSNSIHFKTYLTHENTGNSYNIRSMAENIDRGYKSDTQWYNDFTNQYNIAIASGTTTTEALQAARGFADNGRPMPGTAAFKTLEKNLGNINNWDYGAALRVKSYLYHAEAQWDLTKKLLPTLKEKYGITILTGFDYRTYIVIPDGNYFINPEHTGKNLTYTKFGGFAQASKTLWNEKIKISSTIRVDKNQYFKPKYNPRVSIVYSPTNNHSIRASYQNGYRFPSLFEGFSNVNSGGVKRVGGLPIMSHGIFEDSYYKTSVEAYQAAVINDVNKLGISTDSAVARNKNKLIKNSYSYIQPEHINSYELGYKSQLFNKKLFIDVDAYYNIYHSFIAQIEVNVPTSQNEDSIAYYLNDKTKQSKYRMWTNSRTTVYNYGGSAGLKYNFYKKFTLGGNVSFAKLDRVSNDDGLEESFNTPQWITNVSFGNSNLWKNFGFGINFKWQSSYVWQSSLATGNVRGYHNFDAHLSYYFTKQNLDAKLGATNLLNKYYTSFTAGPSIGGFYYLTLSYNINQ